MARIHFQKPGLQTLIQDMGRPGYQAFGVPLSGAFDKTSAKMANWLVGNPLHAPLLEITYMGPKIAIEGACQIALAGADLSAMINQQAIPLYETLSLLGKSTLTFGRLVNGCRAYLAMRGKWQVSSWLNSHSALLNAGPSVLPSSIIKKGSTIEVLSEDTIPKRVIPASFRPDFPSYIDVKVLAGPEFECLSKENIAYFFSQTYRISSSANRMGYRLEGQAIHTEVKSEIISSGILPGTIQLTHSGLPIILLADAQTTGGYFRIAHLLNTEIDRLAQLKPGDQLRFQLTSLEEAHELLREKHEQLLRWT